MNGWAYAFWAYIDFWGSHYKFHTRTFRAVQSALYEFSGCARVLHCENGSSWHRIRRFLFSVPFSALDDEYVSRGFFARSLSKTVGYSNCMELSAYSFHEPFYAFSNSNWMNTLSGIRHTRIVLLLAPCVWTYESWDEAAWQTFYRRRYICKMHRNRECRYNVNGIASN